MQHHADKIADWLLNGLELKSTLFHVGQYCGTWQASTAGRHCASFHIVLHGECWLHLPPADGRDARSVRLGQGDAVFLLRDVPHCVSPDPQPPAHGRESARAGTMTPLADAGRPGDAQPAGSTGIACGFFEFRSGLDNLLLGLLPDHVVARRDHPSLGGARAIFELIRAEALRDPHALSPLIARLTDLLFVYALRALDGHDHVAPCFWALLRDAEFAPLVAAIVEAPSERWTTQAMADFVHMSRARFCKQFVEIAGQPPAQFVTLIRMKLAAAILGAGARTPDAAERVGYQSESAFAHAFKRVTGVQPGAWRRARGPQDDDGNADVNGDGDDGINGDARASRRANAAALH
ncbi:AraC family transcriptional regulator [Paraburkholderia caballeronis]|uniref:AraC family transcriptional regulator n=1 Tax=Paraburkholderia caballeronis TaxID=416943 RepID=UPI001067177F|nr:AraC family transcriptional regulator [Paraburkholderia caballeronis]TDV16465.1 AraC family transcriptional regulator [Paraburkholderia caballeronis]TDV18861.1 AraC family transcriptional regulator [Paraburkholderia caballeronis]TDV26994.1 AraC family transcriptional regulator [Paraburkholderia caballeronis]